MAELLEQNGVKYTFRKNVATELKYQAFEYKAYFKEIKPNVYEQVFNEFVYCRNRGDFLALLEIWNRSNPKLWRYV